MLKKKNSGGNIRKKREKTIYDNLGDDEKEQVGKDDKKERWTNVYKL